MTDVTQTEMVTEAASVPAGADGVLDAGVDPVGGVDAGVIGAALPDLAAGGRSGRGWRRRHRK